MSKNLNIILISKKEKHKYMTLNIYFFSAPRNHLLIYV